MSQQSIDGLLLKEMIIAGANLLEQNREAIDALNVFPVPDGDTGTNMSLTMKSTVKEISALDEPSASKLLSMAARGALKGARGNSGVILSQILRGFARGIDGAETIDAETFAKGLEAGAKTAYKAVMKPKEGTILTVSRLTADAARDLAEENSEIEYVLQHCLDTAHAALDNTVNQNPVLKKAGVVDAGGMGFCLILRGMLESLRGNDVVCEDTGAANEEADFGIFDSEDITFAFDTVFIVRKREDITSLDPLREYLGSIGDSLVIGEDDEAFKVHVHTDIPGEALTEAQKYGTLELAKIENMRTQAQQLAAGGKAQSTDDLEAIEQELEAAEHENAGEAEPEKDFGFLAVCAGEGLANVFTDLGADGVISGGQTMNPSTESILKEIKKVPAHTVFVLPNNKNIIMAAQQCIGLTEKTVVVIPTASIPQGVSAMMAVDPDMSDADAIAKAMTDAAQCVSTAQITYAARNSDFDGFDIHEGDYLALLDGKLLGTDRDVSALLDGLSDEAASREAEFITVFYGEDVNEEDAHKACDAFTRKCPDAEVNLICGGQPVYYYMISFE